MDERVLVTNVQRFCLHDGPGIRTTIFFKGCAIHCPWCSNPENIDCMEEIINVNGQDVVVGKYLTLNEIFNEVMKDYVFYNIPPFVRNYEYLIEHSIGGVTLSGGEPLLKIKNILPFLKKLKEKGISSAVETSLFVPRDDVELALKYIDIFYVDIKLLNENECYAKLGGDVKKFIENFEILEKASENIIVRIPVIRGETDGETNRSQVVEFLKNRRIKKVELLKGHNLATKKNVYFSHFIDRNNIPDDNIMLKYKDEIEKNTHASVDIYKI